MSFSGMVGMGEGLCGNKPCAKVYVIKKKESEREIPKNLEGYLASVDEITEIVHCPVIFFWNYSCGDSY